MNLEDKVVVVTGSTRGYGFAIAESMLEAGASVAITGRSKEAIQQAVDRLQTKGRVNGFVLDVREERHVYNLVKDVLKEFGRIDIALLNIGIGPSLNIATACPGDIKQNMRMNYDTMVNFFCPLVKQMKTQDSGGIIANTNSLAGFLGMPTQGQYSAAKAACRIFLDTARIELKPFNIRVLTLCPGFVVTERNKHHGLPKSLTMSMDEAAQHILKALKSETREYMFPPSLKMAVVVGRALPNFLKDKILSKMAD